MDEDKKDELYSDLLACVKMRPGSWGHAPSK